MTEPKGDPNSPFVLTTIDHHAIILRKNHPAYKAKNGDMFLGIDCVLANEHRLTDISSEYGYGETDPIYLLAE